jgi:hypothetical protein
MRALAGGSAQDWNRERGGVMRVHGGWFFAFVEVLLLSLPGWATAADYYVAPTGGSDSNNGSIGSPFATINKGIDFAQPGDTIWVRGGSYTPTSRVNIPANRNGTAVSPINLFAFPGETPIIDGTNHSDHGFRIIGDYWHVKGFVVQHSTQTGLQIFGHNNIAENMTLRWNTRSGVQLRDGSSKRPSNNVILNSDAYENADLPSGEDADGFTAKYGVGTGNVFRGNRAWGNSDDGYDFWEADRGVIVEDSWSWANGINIWGVSGFAGDGTGFKLGKRSGPHVLKNLLAWGNNSNGIDVNENGTDVLVYNATSYNNVKYNFQWDEGLPGHVLRNNISLAGGMGVNGVQILAPTVHDHNSWNGGLAVSEADFLSLDDTIARGPRLPDGSLPVSDFLKLKPTSMLIDAGVDVGLPFNGLSPDLGAFETMAAVAPMLPGDYNDDGVVDAADYTVWRDHWNTPFEMPNDETPGMVDDDDYDVWVSHFGEAQSGGASLGGGANVPEPASLVLVIVVSIMSVPRSRPT